MGGSSESFVGWIKQQVEAIEHQPVDRRVCNLSTSGVHTPTIDSWFQRTCEERLPLLLEQMEATNEFGLSALKEAIRRKYRVPENREIYLTPGASGGYRLICESLFVGGSGLEVLVESPTYQPLAGLPPRYGAKIVPVPIPIKRSSGDLAAAFGRAVRPTTSAVVVSNLHNPTGSFLSRDEAAELARAATAVSPKITVIIDETFLGLGPEPFRTAADLNPSIVTVSSLTKTFGLGQLRCGWLIADKDRYPQLLDDWVQFEGIGSKVLEALGVIAFNQIDTLLRQSIEHLETNRRLLATELDSLKRADLLEGDVPTHGCLAFPRWKGRTALDVVAAKLREEFGVLVSPGRFFGADCAEHLRIGFGGSEDVVREGLGRLARGLRALS
jgi:aspartate/methionine/tyrosine aminotransferase